MGPVIYFPLYEDLVKYVCSRRKIFSVYILFFTCGNGILATEISICTSLNHQNYLPDHCHWFQHGHMSQSGTTGVFSMSLIHL